VRQAVKIINLAVAAVSGETEEGHGSRLDIEPKTPSSSGMEK
jgi:hypothetical protein